MNAKISVFAICVEAILYMLLYDFYDCKFKLTTDYSKSTICEQQRG